MSDIEDKDLGFTVMMKELNALSGLSVTTGVHADQSSEMVSNAARHEYGSDPWTVTSKQAYFMARVLMQIDPAAEPARFWGTFRKLRGKIMRIPERSFIRSTYDRDQLLLQKLMYQAYDEVLEGRMTARVALQQFALLSEKICFDGFAHITPPLAALTVALRPRGDGEGNHMPLVNHGHLRRAVKSYIEGLT